LGIVPGGSSDEIEDEMEVLLPELIAAGYVDATEDRWTPKGVARAKQLESDVPARSRTKPGMVGWGGS
jgi:hypothetical protein